MDSADTKARFMMTLSKTGSLKSPVTEQSEPA